MSEPGHGRVWRHRMKHVEYTNVGAAMIHNIPECKCGRQMRPRAAYLMGGADDWVAFECPQDNIVELELHSNWIVQRAKEAE